MTAVISALNTRTRQRANGVAVMRMHSGNPTRSRHATVSDTGIFCSCVLYRRCSRLDAEAGMSFCLLSNDSPRPTQPGHPSVCRHMEYANAAEI